MEKCNYEKRKVRSAKDHKLLMNRLNRIEGQVRGVKNMIENDVYCTDILTQVAAITAALNAFNREILSEHIRTCVKDDIKNGNDKTIDELILTLKKLMK